MSNVRLFGGLLQNGRREAAAPGRLPAQSTLVGAGFNAELVLAVALCVVLGLIFISSTATVVDGKTYFTLHDDIMISMTYARNLAEGHGLVWVPGEAPLEGFTNPLWTLYLSFLHLISPVDRWVPVLVALSGVGGLVAGLFGVDALARRLNANDAGRFFALLSAATLYAPAFWSVHGFEMSFLIALNTWMVVIALDRSDRWLRTAVLLGIMGSIALLTRLDSIVATGGIIGLRLLRLDRRAFVEIAIAGAMIVVVGVVLFLARYAYFGDWLPNTAYLKLSNMPMLDRLLAGIKADYHAALRWAPLGLLALAPVVLLFRGPLRPFLDYLGVLAVVALQFAYCAYVGGDAWEWSGFPNRYLSLAAFALCTCAGIGAGMLIERFTAGRAMPRVFAAIAALAAFGWTSMGDWIDTAQGHGFQWAEEKRTVHAGVALREGTTEDFSYAVTWAGMLPYQARRHPVDLLGKMDAVIARMDPVDNFKPGHNKYDLDYSIGERRPDAMLHIMEVPDMAAKMTAWGYVETPGGWWILKDSLSKVDPALLDMSFDPSVSVEN